MLVCAQEYFRVGVAHKDVAERAQLIPQFPEIIYFPIESDGYAGASIAHWLARSVRVDDGKPSVAEKHLMARSAAIKLTQAFVIGTAVRDRI
jgi:hypothetical protein